MDQHMFTITCTCDHVGVACSIHHMRIILLRWQTKTNIISEVPAYLSLIIFSIFMQQIIQCGVLRVHIHLNFFITFFSVMVVDDVMFTLESGFWVFMIRGDSVTSLPPIIYCNVNWMLAACFMGSMYFLLLCVLYLASALCIASIES